MIKKSNSLIVSVFLICSGIALIGCQDLTVKLPAGTRNPEQYFTPEGAEMMARGARFIFQAHLLTYMRESGGFSDELREDHEGAPVGGFHGIQTEISARLVPEVRSGRGASNESQLWPDNLGAYSGLQQIRGQTLQARQVLAVYGSNDNREVLRAEMFLYEAFAVTLLADLFCSGVPLTTVEFERGVKYHHGATTSQLYQEAITLFDSAIVLSFGDPKINDAARIGKARAALAIGRYVLADTSVRGIADGFRYELPLLGTGTVSASTPLGYSWNGSFSSYSRIGAATGPFSYVADSKGGNGLPYLSGHDPRILVDSAVSAILRTNLYGIPNKFPIARSALLVADHIEAKLIQAEAALHAGLSEWLHILNGLRTSGLYTVPSVGDTVWAAGTGGVARLKPLEDPADTAGLGTDIFAARLNLIFQERGYWLFLTGHRQGDLRRLVREYGRSPETVYPWGVYRGGTGEYGEFINLPIPTSERKSNPKFLGCQGRDS